MAGASRPLTGERLRLLSPHTQVCLLLLASTPEAFYELAACRRSLEERLRSQARRTNPFPNSTQHT